MPDPIVIEITEVAPIEISVADSVYVIGGGGGGGGAVDSVNGQTGVVVVDASEIPETAGAKILTAAERTKLAGVATGATANQSDAFLLARANHTGTQLAATISDLGSVIATAIAGVIASAPGALDTLDELAAALADDPNFATTITNALALKAPLASPTFTGTVSGVTKAHVGLSNVDNTSDSGKPVSTAQATADGVVQAFAIQRGNHAGSQAQSTVTNLVTDLGNKLDTSAAPELIRDTMATALVAGSNVTITPNDGADTITIASTAGGGGGITTEDAVDAVNAALVVTGNLSRVYNDAGDTLTLDVPQGIPALASEPAGPVGLVWVKDLGSNAFSLQVKI